jgi:hypothetical protein
MMSNYNGINDIQLENMEHGKLLQGVRNAKSTRTLKVAVPKIMSLGNNGVRDYNIDIDKSLLLNANIPKVPSRVTGRNYISVDLVDSAFRGPYREVGKDKVIPLNAGEAITIYVPNGNIKNIKATDWSVS